MLNGSLGCIIVQQHWQFVTCKLSHDEAYIKEVGVQLYNADSQVHLISEAEVLVVCL